MLASKSSSRMERPPTFSLEIKLSHRTFSYFFPNPALAWRISAFEMELSRRASSHWTLNRALARNAFFFFSGWSSRSIFLLSFLVSWLLVAMFLVYPFFSRPVGLLAFWMLCLLNFLVSYCWPLGLLASWLFGFLVVRLFRFLFFRLFGLFAYLTFCLLSIGCLAFWLLSFLASSISGCIVFSLAVPSCSSIGSSSSSSSGGGGGGGGGGQNNAAPWRFSKMRSRPL